jgi:hypothetical protein
LPYHLNETSRGSSYGKTIGRDTDPDDGVFCRVRFGIEAARETARDADARAGVAGASTIRGTAATRAGHQTVTVVIRQRE